MLLKEYEELMGASCTEEVFDKKINPIYMMTEMDKREFCDDYKLHGHSKILEEVAAHALTLEQGYMNVQKMHDAYAEESCRKMLKVAEHLIKVADDCGCDDSYDLAVELAGQHYVTAFKVREDIDLNEKDKAYILNNLT